MPEKIGKYQVLERIGRGGMGTIFKAHDPVLERSVALKVISSEIEVTDELRARFFREAQAAARLSHPNIVTVYDMGEDDGRLFIVMELLEGEELRRLIVQRTALPLEDKLSVMVQVCDGLHYAHQKGIVHRDVKPGNIMRLHNGQAKILDFGIAQIANTEGGLTRTGLIMGTLRYMSPEQVRGQADHRSDIFSVGAVFYELLSLRPPFGAENPMQLLDQLRTEEPPLLNQVDPTIPPELAVIVERAIRKNPGERFADLEQMRAALEQVLRALTEEAQRVRARVRGQRDQLVQLHAVLTERIGPRREDEAIPAIDERSRLATLQALERDLAGRIETHRMRIARADALAAGLRRGRELLEAGHFGDAATEFEAIVAQMPEHAQAGEGLEQARAQAQAQRRRQLAAKLLQDARAALDDGAYALGLELLKQAAEIPPPTEAAQEIAAVRETAEAALRAQEAIRRMRQQAERAREQMAQARQAAQAQTAPEYAPALWTEAEAKASEAHAAVGREAYAEAGAAFEAAVAAYGRFAAAAGEAQQRERDAAERAREQMAQGQQRARAAAAPQYARELWEAAEGKSAEAQAAVANKAHGRAVGVFTEAVALYRQAEQAAGAARQRERRRAEEARDRAGQGQRSAAGAEAERHAPALWSEAGAKSMDAEAALAHEQYAKAAEAFDGASALYREAEHQGQEARRRQREQAEQWRQVLAERRRSARAADAAAQAPADWNEAEASSAAGEAAFTRDAYAEARQIFDHGAALYRRAEERARETVRALEMARAEAETGHDAAGRARRVAAEALAPAAAAIPSVAAAREPADSSELVGAVDGGVTVAGATAYSDATRLSPAPPRVGDTGSTRVLTRARDLPESSAGSPWRFRVPAAVIALGGVTTIVVVILHSLSQPPPPGPLREAPAPLAPRGMSSVPTVPSPSAPIVPSPESPSGLDAAVELQKRVMTARDEAARAGAERLASTLFANAAETAGKGDAALAQQDMTNGQQRYREAVEGYGQAKAEATRIAGLARRETDARGAESRAAEARRVADLAEAPKLARALWAKADATLGKADDAFKRQDYDLAQSLFRDADQAYREAGRAASESASALKRDLGLAEQAREVAGRAKQDAEQAAALSLAPRTFASAQQKESEAVGLLNRQEFASARLRFQEAQQAYKQAAQEGATEQQRLVALQRQHSEAEQARDRTARARREAEQASAPRYAPKPLAVAQGKEREATAALGRSEYGLAIRLFGESQSDYQAAALEAKQESEGEQRQIVAAQKLNADRLRSTMPTRREEAVKAEADRLVKDLFALAQAKQAEADGLAGRQNFVAATQSYQDAAEHYREATRRAQGMREARGQADSAKERMLGEKKRANQAAPEFKDGLTEENQANSLYERLSYRDAAEKFRSAETFFVKAAKKPGRPPLPPSF